MSQLREFGEVSTGEVLDGRYRLEERIGEGGMALVYRAEDTLLGRTVAIKILRGALDGLGTVERARSETMLSASLNHHGLVTLFDAHVSEENGSYLVMEYVDGITLRERIARGPLDSAEAAALALDLAEGLHVAHAAGVIHRDIKPSNVLLWRSPVPGHEWRAKIADFGIACLRDSSRLTAPGIMVGTVAYIAPEQARGETPAPPADIYALGLVLIEALTGTRPFAEAEGIGAVMARLQGPPPIPHFLDERWRQLLRGMTAMQPDDRPTALEVAVAAAGLASMPADAVARAPLDTPTAAFISDIAPTGKTSVLPVATAATRPVSAASLATLDAPAPLRRVRTPPRRRRALIAALTLGLLLVTGVVTGSIWVASSLRGLPEPAPTRVIDEELVEPSIAPSPADDGVVPADDTVDDSVGSGNSGDQTTDTTSGNSGPGNNSGKGKGSSDSGPGNGKGKGKGGNG